SGALLLSVAACAPEPGAPGSTPKPSATAEPSASPTPSSSPSPTEAPRPEWDRFEHPDVAYTFEVPTGWSTRVTPQEIDPSVPPLHAVSVVDRAGRVQLTLLDALYGLGGAGGDPVPFRVLDSAPVAVPGTIRESDLDTDPQFVYRAVEYPSGVTASLALSSSAPSLDGTTSFFYNELRFPAGGISFADSLQVSEFSAAEGNTRSFASMAEAEAFMLTDEYETLKRVLTSFAVRG
ncbi:hypothetical protein OOT08_08290, partial [Leucobacter sp. M11]|nr:hypothetical protein [Leucobacter sp. M11]